MKQKDEVLGVKIVGGLQEASTPWAGASLLVELFRRLGVGSVANKVLPAKGSAKGLKQGQSVESFVLLSALGGIVLKTWRDCVRMKGWKPYWATGCRLLRQRGNGWISFMMKH